MCDRSCRIALLSTFGTLILAAAVPTGVQAVETPADAGTLGEIIVTASKRQESILAVPTSITAVSQEQIEQKGVKDMEELARSVPGLAIVPASENEPKVYTLRGIGPSPLTAATVAVYVNDAPITIGANSPDLKLFDIERVEVLRGPQGTLFGSSSMGGAIRYVTPKPAYDAFSGRLRLETSTTSEGSPNYEGQGAVGGPISENFAFRASGYYRHDGGYIDVVDEDTGEVTDKDANSADLAGGQLAFGMRFGESVEAIASVLYQDNDANDLSFFHSLRGMGEPLIPLGELQKTERVDLGLRDRITLPSLLITANLGFADLTSSTSLQRQHTDLVNDLSYFIQGLFGLPGSDLQVPSIRTRHFDAFIQEVRLASKDEGRFNWLVGAYWRDTEQTMDQVIPSNIDTVLGLPGDLFLDVAPGAIETLEQDFKGTELAGFGEVSYNFTDAFELTAGARYSKLTQDVLQVETFAPLLGGGSTVVDLPKSEETPFTPKLAATYTFNKDQMIYATAAKGFREGGPNPTLLLVQSCLDALAEFGLSAPPETYESDNLWSYELGAKFITSNHRMRFQGAVYQIDWSDIQQSIDVGESCGSSPIANFGKARVRGVEAEVSWRALESLTLDLSGAYTDAEITEDMPPLNIVKGTPLSGVPEFSLNVDAQYDFHFTNGWGGYGRAEWQHIGEFQSLPR